MQHLVSCFKSILTCFLLSLTYVSSLYVWNSTHDRDHPSTIKRRFFSAFAMLFVSPVFFYVTTDETWYYKASMFTWLGFRESGCLAALVLPLLLTAILFMGPLFAVYFDGTWRTAIEPLYWSNNLQNWVWIRNQLVAPLSEEFTFRACMLPILLQCCSPMKTIFICPLFFGVAHFHHIRDRIRSGVALKTALLISCFQMTYTTMFGAYSAFLFLRTGHFFAPFIAHAFCNHMGFPDFADVLRRREPNRTVIAVSYVVGLVAWGFLLYPLTEPLLYGNSLYGSLWL